MKKNVVRIILEVPNDILIDQALKFKFKATNNQAEYEALIVAMFLSLKMKASILKANSDS